MKKIAKFGLIVLILLVFIGSIGILSQFFDIPLLSSKVDYWIKCFPWLVQFLKGVLISLIIIFLLLFLFFLAIPGKRTTIDFKEKNRQIKIPRKTIESIVETVTDETIHRDKRKLNIQIKRKNRVVVHLKLFVRNKIKDQLIADNLKKEIETALAEALQTTNHLVNIKLIENDYKSKFFGRNKSRVV